jgi:hypothetical protein
MLAPPLARWRRASPDCRDSRMQHGDGFLSSGALGIFWILLLTLSRLDPVTAGIDSSVVLKDTRDTQSFPWTSLFSIREVWGIITASS